MYSEECRDYFCGARVTCSSFKGRALSFTFVLLQSRDVAIQTCSDGDVVSKFAVTEDAIF